MDNETTSLRCATYARAARPSRDLALEESALVRRALEWRGIEPRRRYREASPQRMSTKMIEQIVAEALLYDFDTLVVASPSTLGRDRPWEIVKALQEVGITVRFTDGPADNALGELRAIDAWLPGTE